MGVRLLDGSKYKKIVWNNVFWNEIVVERVGEGEESVLKREKETKVSFVRLLSKTDSAYSDGRGLLVYCLVFRRWSLRHHDDRRWYPDAPKVHVWHQLNAQLNCMPCPNRPGNANTHYLQCFLYLYLYLKFNTIWSENAAGTLAVSIQAMK